MTPKVKICCIASIEEAQMAIAHGADAIGLVGPMPSGPGVISDEAIAKIVAGVKGIDTFLLTSETSAEEIVNHHKKVNTSTIQIVDKLSDGSHDEIKRELPDVSVVQVVHVTGEASVEEALESAEAADFILLDSGNPNLDVKELGGTGRTHNWEISQQIVEKCPKPVYLAGGLDPKNVGKAIGFVNPYGVDLCSGVRTGGSLDPIKLRQFMDHVRNRRT